MDNQHKKITGYRDLSQQEIDLMNNVKALGTQIEGVLQMVEDHLRAQWTAAHDTEANEEEPFGRKMTPEMLAESERLTKTETFVWLRRAEEDLKVGLMKLTRSIAQPTSF